MRGRGNPTAQPLTDARTRESTKGDQLWRVMQGWERVAGNPDFANGAVHDAPLSQPSGLGLVQRRRIPIRPVSGWFSGAGSPSVRSRADSAAPDPQPSGLGLVQRCRIPNRPVSGWFSGAGSPCGRSRAGSVAPDPHAAGLGLVQRRRIPIRPASGGTSRRRWASLMPARASSISASKGVDRERATSTLMKSSSLVAAR